MSNVPILMCDSCQQRCSQAPPASQRNSIERNSSPWRHDGSAKSSNQPLPGMHQFHSYPTTVRQATCEPLPLHDAQSAFTNPPIHPPASCLPTIYPGRGIPHNPCHPHFRGTLRDHNCSGVQPFFAPMVTRDAVKFQQGHHYHYPACHMSFYNCCTHICRPADHCPNPKRPRIDEDNLVAMTESGITKSAQRVTSQVSKTNETTSSKPLPSPPPLIRNCQNGIEQQTVKQPNLKEIKKEKLHEDSASPEQRFATIREPSTLDAGLTKVPLVHSSMTRCEISKSGYSSELMRKIVTKRNSNALQQKITSHEPDKSATVPPDNNLKSKSISLNGLHKDCPDSHDNRNSCKQSNPPDVEMKSYSTRPVEQQMEQRLPLCVKPCDGPFHHRAAGENAEKSCQTTFFEKPRQSSVIVWNDNQKAGRRRQSCYESVPQEGQSTRERVLRRSQSLPMSEQQSLNMTSRNYRENSGDFYDNKTMMNSDNVKYATASSKEYHELNTEVLKHQYQAQRLNHFTPMPNGTIHPQLQYYPPPEANLQRYRSKSCDYTQTYALKSLSSYCNLQSNTSPYKTQMQSEVSHDQGLKNKPEGCGGVQTCSPTSRRRYQRSKSTFDERLQSSHTMQNDGDEMFCESSCDDNNTNNTKQINTMGYYQSASASRTNLNKLAYERQERYQDAVMQQWQATMNLERPPYQQPNTSSRSEINMPPFQQNQLLSSDRSHMPIRDPTQIGALTHNNVPLDQCHRPPSLACHEATNASTVYDNKMSSLPPCNGSLKIRGSTSLNELEKRRAELSKDHTRSNYLKEGKDVDQLRNHPMDIQMSHCQDRKREPTQYHWKLTDTTRFEGHQKPTVLICDEHCRPNMRRISNERTAVQSSQSQEATQEPKRYQKEDGSATLRIPIPSVNDAESHNHGVKISITSGNHHSNNAKNKTLNDQAAGTFKPQPTCQSRTLPPLPSGKELDNFQDSGCGGYAIDHGALPRIVAVHSIITHDEALQKQEADLFSVSDKKFWSELQHKLTSDINEGSESKSDKIPHGNQSQTKKVKNPQDVTFRLENDPSRHQNHLSTVKKWTLWKYLSSPSRELTIEIKSPTEYVEIEKNPLPPRKKLTVAELSEKVLYTRERIKKETIPWKKKLLVSLEATFLKRLRKTEKETGEKADIPIKKDQNNEECKEKKSGEKEKCNKPGRKKKIVVNSVR